MADRLGIIMKRATDVLALLGAVGVVAMLVHICAYVIGRHLVATPIPATVEIVSSYYMVLIAFLPLAWAQRRGDMITVEVFAPLFGGPLRKLDAIFVALVTAAAYLVLTYTTWQVAMREFAAKSFVISLNVALPTWPSYFILPLGFGLAAIVSVLKVFLVLTDAEDSAISDRIMEEEFRE